VGVVLVAAGVALLAVVGVLALLRGGGDEATPRSTLVPPSASASPGRTPLTAFGEVAVEVVAADGGSDEFCVLAAETAEQRRRGLMEVTDPTLGGYDGMLFVFPDDDNGGFWMRNTPMPLSIAYFDQQGALVSTADMEPCGDTASCPSYAADGPYRYALEVPQGGLARLGIGPAGSRLRVRAACGPSG